MYIPVSLILPFFSISDNNKKVTARPGTDRSERNVKFAAESREERNNRRNREDRPASTQSDFPRYVTKCVMHLYAISPLCFGEHLNFFMCLFFVKF